MKRYRNLGNLDRLIRFAVSIALIYIGFFATHLINDPLFNFLIGAFGVLNLVSVALGVCLIYTAAGISSYKRPEYR